jgi:hypothetical protein
LLLLLCLWLAALWWLLLALALALVVLVPQRQEPVLG